MPILSIPEFISRIASFLQVGPQVVVRRLLTMAVIWGVAWLCDRVVRLLARRIERAVDDGDDNTMTMQEKQGRTVAQLLRSVGRFLIIALALLMTLNQFINIGPILAGAGILGLAVSFGAQSLVKDVINGFFMLVESSISVGDTVDIAGKDGHRGTGDAALSCACAMSTAPAHHPERADHDGEQPDPGMVARRCRRHGGL